MPLVKLQNVSLFIPGDKQRKPVLKNINLEIRAGQHYLISGANGAGKSTLLRLLAGELEPADGTAYWRGKNSHSQSRIVAKNLSRLVSPLSLENMRRQNWQIMGSDFLYGPFADEVFIKRLPNPQQESIKLLEQLDAQELIGLPLTSMSEGQLKLLLLARAILAQPILLLLDECFTALDASHQQLLLACLEKFSRAHTIVMAAHDLPIAPAWAQTRLNITSGCLTPGQVESSPQTTVVVSQKAPKNPQIIFELKNVSVYIERKLVLKNLNWKMFQGQNWIIYGSNGSGKSTFLRLLAGDEFCAANGSLRFWSIRHNNFIHSLEQKRQAISLVSELGQSSYGYNLTALQLVCSGFDNTVGVYRDFSECEHKQASQMLKDFFPEVKNMANNSIRRLSSGQLRRLYLIRALMNQPQVLLLDEPLNGLDLQSREAYLNLLQQLINKGLQIVMVSHEPLHASGFKYAVMDKGEIREKSSVAKGQFL